MDAYKNIEAMTEEKIQYEYYTLLVSHIQAMETYTYYRNLNIRMMQELVPLQQEAVEMEIPEDLPFVEKNMKIIEFKRKLAQVEAAHELLKQLDRLKDKSLRKSNEAKQKLDAFRKRHGIENA